MDRIYAVYDLVQVETNRYPIMLFYVVYLSTDLDTPYSALIRDAHE